MYEIACEKLDFKYTCTGTGYSGGSGDSCSGKYKKCSCKSGYKWSNGSCKKESCLSSYKYTCTGTGYAGGSGTSCENKYTQCNCISGYEWKNGLCQKTLNGAQEDLYYCNGTVVGVRASGMDFYVAMNDIGGQMDWNSAKERCQNYSFCDNVKGVLPTREQLVTIRYKKSRINELLISFGGQKLTENLYWSSTVHSYTNSGYVIDMNGSYNDWSKGDNFVRPILIP